MSSNWPGLHHSDVTKPTGKSSHRKVRVPLPKARDRQKQQTATNGGTDELNLRLSLPGYYSCADSLKMRVGPPSPTSLTLIILQTTESRNMLYYSLADTNYPRAPPLAHTGCKPRINLVETIFTVTVSPLLKQYNVK